jgi:uncharacterized small protein (DUF1192 family)
MTSSEDTDARIEELTARIAILKAAIETGSTVPRSTSNQTNYPFLAALHDDNLLAAKTLIEENAVLHARVASLESTIEERDYRILHLKQNVARLIP